MADVHRDEIAKLEALFSANPDGRVFTHLADAYRKAGDLVRARETVEHGLERHGDYPSAHVVLGRVLLDVGDAAGADAAFRRVLELDPENRVALRALAEIAREAGRDGEAAAFLRELLLLDPNDNEIEALARAAEERARGGAKTAAPAVAGVGSHAAAGAAGDAGADVTDGVGDASNEAAVTDSAGAGDGDAAAFTPGFPGPEDPVHGVETPGYTPVVTETMAEIYLAQGLYERAASVYRQLLRERPEDERLLGRLREVEAILAGGLATEAQGEAGPGATAAPETLAAPAEVSYFAADEPEEAGEVHVSFAEGGLEPLPAIPDWAAQADAAALDEDAAAPLGEGDDGLELENAPAARVLPDLDAANGIDPDGGLVMDAAEAGWLLPGEAAWVPEEDSALEPEEDPAVELEAGALAIEAAILDELAVEAVVEPIADLVPLGGGMEAAVARTGQSIGVYLTRMVGFQPTAGAPASEALAAAVPAFTESADDPLPDLHLEGEVAVELEAEQEEPGILLLDESLVVEEGAEDPLEDEFDRLFSGTDEDAGVPSAPAASGAPVPPNAAPASRAAAPGGGAATGDDADDDLEMFRAWLQNLKR